MTYIKKENLYDLLVDFETVYPEAAAAFRVAVSELPEGLVRCRNCDAYTTERPGGLCRGAPAMSALFT